MTIQRPFDWPLSRRAMLGSLAAAPLALAACGKSPSSGGRRKIRIGHSSAAVALSTAVEEGLFEKLGLDVELLPIQSGPAAVAATVGGALDFTFGDFLGWAAALANGFANCKLVSPANGNGNLVVLGRKQLAGPRGLAGKRIGVGPAPVFALSTKLWLRKIGVDPESVELVITNQGSEHALGRGDIDALVAFDPVAYEAEKKYGAHVIAGDPSAAVMPAGAGRACYYVNGDYAKANPETVRQIVTCLHQGGRSFASAAPLRKAELLSNYIGFSVAQMRRDMPGLIEHFRHPPVQLTPFDIAANQRWVDIAAHEGAIPKSIDIAPFIHETALEGA